MKKEKDLIYVVEDDPNIRELIKYTLETNDFDVLVFENGDGLLSSIKNVKPSLIILDIMLNTKTTGIDILKTVREKYGNSDIKVIMVSAKNSEINIVQGLNLGADDYITKPFSVLELVARVNARLRRDNTDKNKTDINFGTIKIMLNKNIVYENEKEIYLTDKEYLILRLLVDNAYRVVDRETIFERVWGDSIAESRTIDMHIKTLREKIKFCSNNIITVRSIGYKIVEG